MQIGGKGRGWRGYTKATKVEKSSLSAALLTKKETERKSDGKRRTTKGRVLREYKSTLR